MAYTRVIPRDLFNEAKLLKCLGQLALHVHDGKDGGRLKLTHRSPDRGFVIDQHREDGSLYCCNLACRTADGLKINLASAYNNKSAFPLVYEVGNEHFGDVFNDDGTFSDEFLELIGYGK